MIDCTDHHGQLAGLMLAQLGADVVLLEPPGGSSARHLPPFAGDNPSLETGLWHWAYNRGKRSVTADLGTSEGRERLAQLAAGADVVLWNGRAEAMPFRYDELAAANPGLVVVAMTPFGLDGPKAAWAATDLIVSAAGCGAVLMGNADRPPLRWGSPQAFLHGAADMAVAALVCLHERARSGRGQLADVSAQVSCIQSSFCYTLNAAWDAPEMHRDGEGIDFGAYRLRWTYPASDGEVSITVSFSAAMAGFMENLFAWIWEEGGCDEATRDLPWAEMGAKFFTGEVDRAEADRVCAVITRFTATRTKAYLASEARRRRVLLAPVAALTEVVANDHLAARDYWDLLPALEGARPHRFPGRFVVSEVAPLAKLGPPPTLGAHNHAAAGVPAFPATAAGPVLDLTDRGAGALGGLAVLDLSWSVAGPTMGRQLADFGATVVQIGCRVRPDVARTSPPFHRLNDRFPFEGTGLHANTNAGKLSVELDLSTPAGLEVCLDLVAWADVVVESFSAGALGRMGLGYEVLAARNPGVILLSSCLPGQTGTLDMPGLGNLTTALFGFTSVSGWPDRSPAGPFGAYTDVVSPRFGLAALLAALDFRQRTGKGQHLDLSQAEASLHLMTPALLDAEVNGRDFQRRGNRDLAMAPHGIYPSAGEDCWLALACDDDASWLRLARHTGLDDLAELSLAERLVAQDHLDVRLAAWTATRDPEQVQSELQAIGVAAHQVQNSRECLADAQLAARGHYVSVAHPLLGPVMVEGPRFRLTRTPGRTIRPGPVYGQDRDRVLCDLLGYPSDRVETLAVAGAFGPSREPSVAPR